MFDRRRARRLRSDVSLVTDVLAAIKASRIAGEPIPVHELPVVVGLVNLYADVLADMPIVPANGTGNAAARRRPMQPPWPGSSAW